MEAIRTAPHAIRAASDDLLDDSEFLLEAMKADRDVRKAFLDETRHELLLAEISESSEKQVATIPHLDGYYGEWGTYTGEVVDGVPNGRGEFTKADIYEYEGEWKDGKRHGQGSYTHSLRHQTRKFVGVWKDDKKWEGTEYLGSDEHIGRIEVSWSEGVRTEK